MHLSKVLILGATGFIGSAISKKLINDGHCVTGLARSNQAQKVLESFDMSVLRGDIRKPEEWVAQLKDFDAVIQTAITWSDDMDQVDQHLIQSIISVLNSSENEKTLIYTGGCWVYGETGLESATEESSYSPIPEFSWMVDIAAEAGQQQNLRWMVVHPAMVYQDIDGVLEHMVDDAVNAKQIRVVGDEQTCWTMVHREDLAQLYALVLERGEKGHHYNGAGIESVNVSLIAKAIANRFNVSDQLEYLSAEQAMAEWGSWAKGYALSQSMSSQKAMTQLGWSPRHNNICESIAKASQA